MDSRFAWEFDVDENGKLSKRSYSLSFEWWNPFFKIIKKMRFPSDHIFLCLGLIFSSVNCDNSNDKLPKLNKDTCEHVERENVISVTCKSRNDNLPTLNKDTCEHVEFEQLPWGASTDIILSKLEFLGFKDCTLHYFSDQKGLGPYVKCTCRDRHIGVIYKWRLKNVNHPESPAIEKFQLYYDSLKHCQVALKNYIVEGYKVDTTLEPSEISIYRKKNRMNKHFTILLDDCKRENVLEIRQIKAKWLSEIW